MRLKIHNYLTPRRPAPGLAGRLRSFAPQDKRPRADDCGGDCECDACRSANLFGRARGADQLKKWMATVSWFDNNTRHSEYVEVYGADQKAAAFNANRVIATRHRGARGIQVERVDDYMGPA